MNKINENHYVQIPVTDYNRLPIFETNIIETTDDVAMMNAMIRGLRNYADYLEKSTKERETEILDEMASYEASTHFEDYMNLPEESGREPDPCEVPDFEGNYNCPFDSNGPDDCRRHCGVGVDE